MTTDGNGKSLRSGLNEFMDGLFDAVGEFVAAAKTPPNDPRPEPAPEPRPFDAGYARKVIGDTRQTLSQMLRKGDVAYMRLLGTNSGWVHVDADPHIANTTDDVVIDGTVLGEFDGRVNRSWFLAPDTIVIIRPRKNPAA